MVTQSSFNSVLLNRLLPFFLVAHLSGDKTLLPKITHTLAKGHREINLELTWTFVSFLDVFHSHRMYNTGRWKEKTSMVLGRAEPSILQYKTVRQDVSSGATMS